MQFFTSYFFHKKKVEAQNCVCMCTKCKLKICAKLNSQEPEASLPLIPSLDLKNEKKLIPKKDVIYYYYPIVSCCSLSDFRFK